MWQPRVTDNALYVRLYKTSAQNYLFVTKNKRSKPHAVKMF